MTVVRTEDAGPLRPGVVAGALLRGLGQELEVDDGLGAVTDGGTDAVVTGVTTTDDDDVLALSRDVGLVGELGVEERLCVLVQELHGEVHALEVAVGDGQVTGDGCTSGQDDSVVLCAERFEGWLALSADSDTSHELDALGSEEVNTTLDDLLVELHVGDTVHEQTTNAVGALEDGDFVAALVELVGGSETCRARADNGNLLASARLRRSWDHPAHLETTVDDGALDGLDADRVLVDTKNTGTLARGRADTTGELREVVGLGLCQQGSTHDTMMVQIIMNLP